MVETLFYARFSHAFFTLDFFWFSFHRPRLDYIFVCSLSLSPLCLSLSFLSLSTFSLTSLFHALTRSFSPLYIFLFYLSIYLYLFNVIPISLYISLSLSLSPPLSFYLSLSSYLSFYYESIIFSVFLSLSVLRFRLSSSFSLSVSLCLLAFTGVKTSRFITSLKINYIEYRMT